MRERVEQAGVGSFLRAHEQDILDDWARRAEELPSLRRLRPDELRDALPRLLVEIADRCDGVAPLRPAPPPAATEHAEDRLDEGVDLADVVAEYAVLRESILRVWPGAFTDELLVLNGAFDAAIVEAVERYTRAAARAFGAIDRISAAAVESTTVDELLRALLAALVETMPSIDTAAVLLREGERLRVRAAVGLEREIELGFCVPIGQGFAGTIAASAQPLLLRSPATSPVVRSPLLRKAGLRALYGVPLVHEGRVVGVAHAGSCTASEFSRQDRRIVAAMAERATMGIVQQQLRAEAEAARVAAERAAREVSLERTRLTQVLEQMPLGVHIAAAPSGAITFGNRAALEIFGRFVPTSDVAGYAEWRLHDARGAPIPPERLPLARALREGEPVDGEDLAFTPVEGRAPTILRVHAGPIRDLERAIVGAVAVFQDVTGERRLVAEREQLLDRERAAREAAEAAGRSRADVLSIVSHDLKNPLSAVLLGASVADRALARGDADRALDATATIRRAAARMDELVRDVLDAAQIEAHLFAVEPREWSSRELVAEAVEAQAAIAQAHGVVLLSSIDGDASVRADRHRLAQVFANLIGNALKFVARGGHVRIAARPLAGCVEFTVTDDGPGIAPDVLPHVFERFRRGTGPSAGGAGLGLFIARGIVEAHGGAISVESEPGRGTTFRFDVPRARA